MASGNHASLVAYSPSCSGLSNLPLGKKLPALALASAAQNRDHSWPGRRIVADAADGLGVLKPVMAAETEHDIR
jgi:hypothetical protein